MDDGSKALRRRQLREAARVAEGLTSEQQRAIEENGRRAIHERRKERGLNGPFAPFGERPA